MANLKTASIGGALLMLALPAAAAAPAPLAASWTVDRGASSISFSGIANDTAFSGSFSGWTAAINFAPGDLAHSQAVVEIETASASTGDPSRDDPLQEDAWFAPGTYPTATFATDTITETAPGSYQASGKLTMRGISMPVTLPFTLDIDGDDATMTGTTKIDRTLWNLGAGAWQDHSVSNDITVTVKLAAHRAG